jgi:tetratricopeptide (TPR) repeat protein
MDEKTLRSLTLSGIFFLALLFQAHTLYAGALRNLAVLQLQPLWQAFSEPIVDPPCRKAGEFSDLRQLILPSIQAGNERARTHLGRALWLEGSCEEAIEAWKQAWTATQDLTAAFELIRVGEYAILSLEVRQTVAESFYQQAIRLDLQGEKQQALPWFSRSFDLIPQHKSASKIAEFYRAAGDTAAARRVWEKLAEKTPAGNAEHWWAKAELYGMDQQWEAAARAYTEGARVSVEPYGFWMGAGSAWTNARQWDAALTAYERAYQENPAAWTCIMLGNVYRARQQYDEALKWYAEAQAKSPRDAEVYYRFGETYYVMGDYAHARIYLDQALQIDPDHFLSMYYVARIYYDGGNRDLAEKWMLDALARIPWRDARAAWWIELGDWRLQWRDCDGARDANACAREGGAKEQTIQMKTKTLVEICSRK